jgi:hypothetical protein
MELTAENVGLIFQDCLFAKEEIETVKEEDILKVEGVLHNFGLNPSRVEMNREQIKSLLEQLPANFMKGTGDGWSFLNACMTKDGIKWGEHISIEQLLVLGIAAGFVSYCFPRDLWTAFPGGMPYFSIDLEV